jgi:hypothetical protein
MPRKDPVTARLRWDVLQRDGRCFASTLDEAHRCFDGWGNPHQPTDLKKLTLDHVHDEGGTMGKRAPSDLQHLVALCAHTNIKGPSREIRQAQRDYLRGLYQDGQG